MRDSLNGLYFERWKRAVGLPPRFPMLAPLTDELDPTKKFYIGLLQQDLIVEILDRASSPLVAVLVNKGHGCSTLARYIFNEISRNCVRHRLIPVHLSLEEIEAALPTSDTNPDEPARRQRSVRHNLLPVIEETMRRGIVRSLVLHPWDRVLGTRKYAGLLGAVAPSPLTSSARTIDAYDTAGMSRTVPASVLSQVDNHRLALRLILGPDPDWKVIRKIAPTLALPINDLVATLSINYGLRVSLQLDLSSGKHKKVRSCGEGIADEYTDAYYQFILDITKAIKILHEKTGSTYDLLGTWNELYFVSPEGFEMLTSSGYGWSRPYHQIDYPWYRAADVFSILAHHYQPHGSLGPSQAGVLASVLDSGLLHPLVSPEASLTTTVRCLADELQNSMTTWEETSFHLKPRKAQVPFSVLDKEVASLSNEVQELKRILSRM